MVYEFGFIAADTSRTRAYLNVMERSRILPSWILVLDGKNAKTLPGQAAEKSDSEMIYDENWPEANFNPSEPLCPWIEKLGLSYIVAGTRNINDPLVVKIISTAKQNLIVYSGYGGGILRQDILATGKKFLHVHGGAPYLVGKPPLVHFKEKRDVDRQT